MLTSKELISPFPLRSARHAKENPTVTAAPAPSESAFGCKSTEGEAQVTPIARKEDLHDR